MNTAAPEVSVLRLNLLRCLYLLVVVGLGIILWPNILFHAKPWTLSGGVVNCMLGAFSLLCLFGLRYPLQMLPMLLWELTWKTLWLSIHVLPLYRAGQLDAATEASAWECLVVVIFIFVLPWRYMARHYFGKASEAWR